MASSGTQAKTMEADVGRSLNLSESIFAPSEAARLAAFRGLITVETR
jgi:hypothetical protein